MNQYGLNPVEETAMHTMEITSAHLADLEAQAFDYAAKKDSKSASELLYNAELYAGRSGSAKAYAVFYNQHYGKNRSNHEGGREVFHLSDNHQYCRF